MLSPAPKPSFDRPPLAYWTLPALVSILRALPYLRAIRMEPSAGLAVVKVGYNAQDWLAYLAMIRQVADRGAFFFENPFTTDAQSPRFVLLFHWLVGVVSAAADVNPAVVLELSRIPLLFVFFGVLWWFVQPFLASRSERLWATTLVGLGGGLDVYARPFADVLPHGLGDLLRTATWQLYGWSTFGAAYNPLWIAALLILLILLRPVLTTNRYGPRRILLLGLGLALLWWIHPYSAIAFIAIAVSHEATRAVLDRRWTGVLDLASVGAVFALLTAPIILWQRMDPAFRAASNGFLGNLPLSVFWYPLTFGVILLFAVLGLRNWRREGHPYRKALPCWIVAVAVLHSSPIWNGYHYVMYQHIPLSMLAAVGIAALARDLGARRSRDAGVIAILALAFGAPVLLTGEAIEAVRRRDRVATETFELTDHLSKRRAGNVLASVHLGNLIPAYTHHKVFAGHWFLTPDNPAKSHLYDRLVSDPVGTRELGLLLDEQRIDYLVVPSPGDGIAAALDDRVRERRTFGRFELLILRRATTPDREETLSGSPQPVEALQPNSSPSRSEPRLSLRP